MEMVMTSGTFELLFEELDFEIPGGFWLPACLSGTASIDVDDGEWSVATCAIDVCGTKMAFYSASNTNGYTRNPEFCAAVERAISRNTASICSIRDQIGELHYQQREFEREWA